MRIILCLLTAASLAVAIPVSTTKSSNRYNTEGAVYFQVPYSNVHRVLTDYSNYNAWLLNGLNGKDDVSKNFLLIMKEITYTTNGRAFILTYDINFIWPFGSTGNQLTLGIDASNTVGKAHTLRLFPLAPISFIDDVVITILISNDNARGTAADFAVTILIAPILDFFFSMDLYKRNIEWRVLRIVENLTEYITTKPHALK